MIVYVVGTEDLIDISTRIGVCAEELIPIVDRLCEIGLLEEADLCANQY
ncbi:MAG: hypothetical protein K2J60_03335 [Acetatifactor sp.]|nr:hypothetical protein [Acetatifactor sp.]